MEKKLYPCIVCGTKVPIRSKGKCPKCRHDERVANGEIGQKKVPIKPITAKRQRQRQKDRGCLGEFFEYHIKQIEKHPYSMESGTIIATPTTANVCHLLPKRKTGGFPSVQCHLDNAVYLTIQEHNRFDKLLDERDYDTLEREFPNTWSAACHKLRKLLTICVERNKMYFSLEEYLKSY
ncbi:MAG: hypothetical protein PQJ49_07980 [Sphaerochaetaceae bacterium]|nr:hypothetical protein [Sphaerochaetaceae bacterium]